MFVMLCVLPYSVINLIIIIIKVRMPGLMTRKLSQISVSQYAEARDRQPFNGFFSCDLSS